MTADEAIKCLSEKYKVIGKIHLPKRSADLYRELKRCWRERFESDERIIIIQDGDDVYDYEGFPGHDIRVLQQTLWQIDISNNFVIVISPNPDLPKELALARELYSKDQSTIATYCCQGQYHKKFLQHDAFCVLPWLHVYVGPQGDVLPCCQSDRQFPIGNIKDKSVYDIMSSTKFNQVRSNMITGHRVKECGSCWQLEDQGMISPRIKANQRWSVDQNTLNKDGVLPVIRPKYIDIRLSNLCNFKCRMCDSYYSSAIAQENAEMYGIATPTVPRSIRAEVLEEIIELLPTLDSIYFAGGEPLLCQEHYDIMDALVACGNTSCTVSYNTNFSVLKFRDREVIDLWNRFENINLAASLDAIGPVAEYVRHGTKWSDIESHFVRITQDAPRVNLSVASTLGFMNIESLIDLQKSWHTKYKLSTTKFTINILTSPSYLTLRVLPEHHKLRLSVLIDQHIDWCQQNNDKRLSQQWQEAKKYMWAHDDSDLLSEFRKVTNKLDHYRRQDFGQILPQFRDLL